MATKADIPEEVRRSIIRMSGDRCCVCQRLIFYPRTPFRTPLKRKRLYCSRRCWVFTGLLTPVIRITNMSLLRKSYSYCSNSCSCSNHKNIIVSPRNTMSFYLMNSNVPSGKFSFEIRDERDQFFSNGIPSGLSYLSCRSFRIVVFC